jgi:hypothetical protein
LCIWGRSIDTGARFDEDEFAVVLPELVWTGGDTMIDRRGFDRRNYERRNHERRARERYPFTAVVEAEDPESGVRIIASSGDLGRGGCYVETNTPFPVDSTVKLHLIKERTSFSVVSKVVHSKTDTGMGLFFGQAEADQLWVLETWLGELTGESAIEARR